tara:strand:- start:1041 stop:1325 length:285 start_codon:yes stop_codon:yes gene_type:complete
MKDNFTVLHGSMWEFTNEEIVPSEKDAIVVALWLVKEYNDDAKLSYTPYEKYDEFSEQDDFKNVKFPKLELQPKTPRCVMAWKCGFDFVEIIKS